MKKNKKAFKKNKPHILLTLSAILLVLGFLAYTLFGSSKRRDIVGTWVTDTAGTECGFQCGTQGIAASIADDSTQYNNWELHRGKLILKGKRFENRRVNAFSDTLKIIKLNQKTLVTVYNGDTIAYHKTR